MPNEFDREACARRNRVAGLRDGCDVAGVTLLERAPEADAVELLECVGELPVTLDAAMEAINLAATAKGQEPLDPEDVHIHYAEAANSRFIPSRYMFLHDSTLKNIADNAGAGVAFMNSHRTGGMSHPSEQPFGHTFAGQYQKYRDKDTGKTTTRACLGVYMLKGVKPAGDQGPSTDDLHRMIEGGTTRDVSVGLSGGDRICDLCAEDLTATKDGEWGPEPLCPHVPGTTQRMSEVEMGGQLERGVPKGRATYSYTDGRMGEISSVFDGAVPNAGFKKALRLFREGALNLAAVEELREAFADVITLSDFRQDRPARDAGQSFADHASQVLATVEALTERIQGYAALRERDGRGVSLDRRAEWARLHLLLGEVLTATEPPASNAARVRALQLKTLALRAGIPIPRA